MTDRVELERQAQQTADAERLAKRLDKEKREGNVTQEKRQAFGQLIKGNAKAQGQQADAQRAKGDALRNAAWGESAQKATQDADRKSSAARSGALHESRAREQAKGFQGTIVDNQKNTADADAGRVERREAGQQKDRIEREDRQMETRTSGDDRVERQRENDQEDVRTQRKEEAQVNAAISGDGKGGGGAGGGAGDNSGQGGEERAIAAAKAAAKNNPNAPVQGPQGSSAPKIPPELLDKLVSTVWLGVNEKGLHEFQLEMKDGPWKGAHVRITAQDGKVTLKFSRVDAHAKALLEASKGELMRRFEKKGLRLESLDVRAS